MTLTQREFDTEFSECITECPSCGSTVPHTERDGCTLPCTNCGAEDHRTNDCTFCKSCMSYECNCVVDVISNDDYWPPDCMVCCDFGCNLCRQKEPEPEEPDWCEYCGLYCSGTCFDPREDDFSDGVSLFETYRADGSLA